MIQVVRLWSLSCREFLVPIECALSLYVSQHRDLTERPTGSHFSGEGAKQPERLYCPCFALWKITNLNCLGVALCAFHNFACYLGLSHFAAMWKNELNTGGDWIEIL